VGVASLGSKHEFALGSKHKWGGEAGEGAVQLEQIPLGFGAGYSQVGILHLAWPEERGRACDPSWACQSLAIPEG